MIPICHQLLINLLLMTPYQSDILNPIPPLLEVPPPDKEPPEATRQHPVHSTGNPNVSQDPFDTQMEVPFAEDTVEPVFKETRNDRL